MVEVWNLLALCKCKRAPFFWNLLVCTLFEWVVGRVGPTYQWSAWQFHAIHTHLWTKPERCRFGSDKMWMLAGRYMVVEHVIARIPSRTGWSWRLPVLEGLCQNDWWTCSSLLGFRVCRRVPHIEIILAIRVTNGSEMFGVSVSPFVCAAHRLLWTAVVWLLADAVGGSGGPLAKRVQDLFFFNDSIQPNSKINVVMIFNMTQCFLTSTESFKSRKQTLWRLEPFMKGERQNKSIAEPGLGSPKTSVYQRVLIEPEAPHDPSQATLHIQCRFGLQNIPHFLTSHSQTVTLAPRSSKLCRRLPVASLPLLCRDLIWASPEIYGVHAGLLGHPLEHRHLLHCFVEFQKGLTGNRIHSILYIYIYIHHWIIGYSHVPTYQWTMLLQHFRLACRQKIARWVCRRSKWGKYQCQQPASQGEQRPLAGELLRTRVIPWDSPDIQRPEAIS